jgi:type I restriction-modification system DNA methylase subunit
MSLFQTSVLNKYLSEQDKELVEKQYAEFKAYFFNPAVQKNIIASKEEEFQEGFLRELFVNILGYTINPAPDFNLRTELKNIKDRKKADGAIIDNEKVLAVIELKGTNTINLNQIEAQAFGYKNNQEGCKYIITSNFRKIRFYIDNAIEFLEWDLFTLDSEGFKLLFLCLQKDNLFKNIPATIKLESVTVEDNVTKKLYKEYSHFRKSLFNNIVEHNPSLDKLLLFKKTQKLLDRFLFLFFAEDRMLVPPNSVRVILDQWTTLKEMDAYQPLYDRFKLYFGYLNTGHRGKVHDIFAYNGGLFAEDEILDNVKMDDAILYDATLSLSKYDYNSEVDVNILGHIFEHSLTEIEELEQEITSIVIGGPYSISKRKKDGVFYTPKYITKYIVENTVGTLCKNKKEELQLQEEDYHLLTKKAKKQLFETLQTYKNWLLQITIIDPACGSGAFLNQALEYLITEHKWISELEANVTSSSIVFDVESSILENNIFGVDINEESVDIAKLSLWLRTASKGRKLNSLNNNIKCGNSLIYDTNVAGDKAFNWHHEFPQIFERGGFDVVIGNPPYVKLESIKSTSEALQKAKFSTYEKRGDLYVLFVEKGFEILKTGGFISYIMPNKWLQAGYGKPLREFMLSQKLNTLIDFGDLQIFQGATTYPCIFVSEKAKPNSHIQIAVLEKTELDFTSNIIRNQQLFKHESFSGDTWIISSNADKAIVEDLQSKFETLAEVIKGEAYYGIKFGLTEAFLINDETAQKLINEDKNSAELIGKILRGRDLSKYRHIDNDDLDNIILAFNGSYKIIEERFPSIYTHLLQFESKLKSRGQCSGSKPTDSKPFWGQHHWLELDNNPSHTYLKQYSNPKIMYQKFQVKPCFIFDTTGLFCNDSMWIIPTDNKAILAILNSKMGWWLISKFCTQIQNGYQLIWKYFGQIPIPDLSTCKELESYAENILSKSKELMLFNKKFQKLLAAQFNKISINTKLGVWYNLSFAEFIKELHKQKINLTLSQQSEWLSFFEQEKQTAIAIKNEIDRTDKKIDYMVYALYGLTDEEIKIVEN